MYANLLQLFTHNPKVLDETKKSIDNFRLVNGLALHLLSKSKNHAARLIKLKFKVCFFAHFHNIPLFVKKNITF